MAPPYHPCYGAMLPLEFCFLLRDREKNTQVSQLAQPISNKYLRNLQLEKRMILICSPRKLNSMVRMGR